MLNLAGIIVVLALVTAAFADDAPVPPPKLDAPAAAQVPSTPAYVPFTVDQKNFENAKVYLGDLPSKIATPVVNWLDNLEFKAKCQAYPKIEGCPVEPAKP